MSGKKTNAMRLLDRANIAYEVCEYPTGDGKIDAVSVAAKIGRPPERVFKTLVTQSADHDFFVFVIPARRELDLKLAAQAAQRKHIAMLPLARLLPLTGYVHGGCSPVGMKKPFPTLIDQSARESALFCVSGGRVGLNLELSPLALAGLLQAEFAELTR